MPTAALGRMAQRRCIEWNPSSPTQAESQIESVGWMWLGAINLAHNGYKKMGRERKIRWHPTRTTSAHKTRFQTPNVKEINIKNQSETFGYGYLKNPSEWKLVKGDDARKTDFTI